MHTIHDPRDDGNSLLAEVRRLRIEQAQTNRYLAAIARVLDQFCGAYLNARFKFGRPVDRWRQQS